jgi:hypothetical protein
MFIRKYTYDQTSLDLNNDEIKVLCKVIDKLIFNPEYVSNQFKVTSRDVEVINQMRTSLNGVKL